MKTPAQHIVGEVFGQETNQAILIKVKNTDALAKSQGGFASFAQTLAPALIESKVYQTIADTLKQKLAEQHVDADVSVVEPNAFRPAGSSHVGTDIGYAIGAFGIIGILWYVFGGKK